MKCISEFIARTLPAILIAATFLSLLLQVNGLGSSLASGFCSSSFPSIGSSKDRSLGTEHSSINKSPSYTNEEGRVRRR